MAFENFAYPSWFLTFFRGIYHALPTMGTFYCHDFLGNCIIPKTAIFH
jgi:hypothetical protein